MNIVQTIYCIISRYTVGLFYSKDYLKGRWFENKTKGWRFCWKAFFMQKLVGYNRHVPFPVSCRNNVGNYKNIHFHPDDLNNFQNFGNYYQASDGHIYIGYGTWIAPNVGIITQNHDISNLNVHVPSKDVILGDYCWIGMNSVILPGVKLGSHTVVGAGSVVTKSFEEGYCVVVGNPARIIRKISVECFFENEK